MNVYKVFKNITNWYFSKGALPYWGVLLMDCAIVMACGYVSTYLVRGGGHIVNHFWPISRGLMLCLVPFVLAFRAFHTYSGIVRYSSFVDLQKIVYAVITGSIFAAVLSKVLAYFDVQYFLMPGPIMILIMLAFITLFMFMMRVGVKSFFDTLRTTRYTKRAFIYGVREGGVSLAKSIRNQMPQQYSLEGFVSPEGDFDIKYLMGVVVRRDDGELIRHMKEAHAEVLIVSPLQANHFRYREDLINRLIKAGIKILMMPEAEEWDGKSEILHQQLREVEIEDLLPRDKIEVDMEAIGAMLHGKRILITGAAGSIGSEIARQVAMFRPAELILVDQAETPMHDVRLFMARNHGDLNIWTIVGSITNQEHMETIFQKHKPEYVFHAAAYKHVPMMEDNPAMAVQNNINGTRVIADLAVKYGTKKFVMISTDKAVNPTNVMGCSKRICEIYCQSLNHKLWEETQPTGRQTTQFITTRFGNVLGSNGSVIPIFKEQIRKGGPVMVTHPDIIRFFMLIPEACRLVLQAGTMGSGGEIYVFDMGEPVKIVDLAKRMIALSGAKNIEIKFSGLRDGEKLYEEVLNDAEMTKPTSHPKIKVAAVREYPYDLARQNEMELHALSLSFDDMAIVKKMKEIVPEFKSQHSKYEALD